MSKPITRISTRGYYDLTNGKTLKSASYFLYPKKDFDDLIGTKELVIMIHGLRNDSSGAVAKTMLARNRLRHIRYCFPVIGFSYDSNIRGAHLSKYAKHSISVGNLIAKKNGRNLALFIQYFKSVSPVTKIRIMGHSLGSQVIISAVENLAKNNQNYGIIESVYFFGASIASDVPSSKKYGPLLEKIIKQKIVNYFSPTDDVLSWANKKNIVRGPLGLGGAVGKTISKYHEKLINPKNHRFASYAAVLTSFP